jgi:Ca2+-binding RTX toxin-like protein
MRKIVLLVACLALTLAVAASALAAVIDCTGGRCQGTNNPDEITGSELRDRIFVLEGADEVQAKAGEDELNGGDGGDGLFGESDDDTYFGGRGEDTISEFFGTTDSRATTR